MKSNYDFSNAVKNPYSPILRNSPKKPGFPTRP